MDRKRALITGVAGQHGSPLAELRLTEGYAAHEIPRRPLSINADRIDHVYRHLRESDNRWITQFREAR